jgi:hypothetical protein
MHPNDGGDSGGAQRSAAHHDSHPRPWARRDAVERWLHLQRAPWPPVSYFAWRAFCWPCAGADSVSHALALAHALAPAPTASPTSVPLFAHDNDDAIRGSEVRTARSRAAGSNRMPRHRRLARTRSGAPNMTSHAPSLMIQHSHHSHHTHHTHTPSPQPATRTLATPQGSTPRRRPAPTICVRNARCSTPPSGEDPLPYTSSILPQP